MIKLLFTLLFFFSSSGLAYEYQLGIAAIFQNEAPYLREWIEFHQMLGVEHFFLYNNNSKDHYESILEPYIKEGIVEVIDWPFSPEENYYIEQMEAYNDAITKSFHIKWLAIIDVNEFIVPVEKDSIVDALIPLGKSTIAGGVKVHWQQFGTGGIWEYPASQTMIEALTLKAQWNHPQNLLGKTICRPDRVQRFWIHGAAYYRPFLEVTMNGVSSIDQPIQINQLRIHKYCTKNEKYFYENEIPRREKIEKRDYNKEEIYQILDETNRVYDPTILRFVPQLQQRLYLNTII